jgi:hypothetical protein
MYEKVKLLSLILDMDRRGHSSEEVPCTKAARQIIMSTILVVRGDHITHQYSTLIWEEDYKKRNQPSQVHNFEAKYALNEQIKVTI